MLNTQFYKISIEARATERDVDAIHFAQVPSVDEIVEVLEEKLVELEADAANSNDIDDREYLGDRIRDMNVAIEVARLTPTLVPPTAGNETNVDVRAAGVELGNVRIETISAFARLSEEQLKLKRLQQLCA